jgi:hypothetical protein
MAEDKTAPDVATFGTEEHDVTCCCEMIFCCGSTTLILGPNEAELIRKYCCGGCNSKKRGPYGELGTVDAGRCFCFYGFGAASLMGEEGEQCTGFGCEQAKVDAIVAELKKRQGLRGDPAKVKMAETTVASLALLHKKIDAVMTHLELAPVTAEMER